MSCEGEKFWQAFWRQGLSEAVGEGATEAANLLADVAVMAEKSDWQQNIRHYLADNPDWNYKQAAKQAFIDAALQVGEASVGGWISGSTMGGGYSTIQNIAANIQKNQQAYDLYGESQQELVREALELNHYNTYAQKLQGKLDSNKQLSGAQLRKLAAQNEFAIQNHDMQNDLTDQNTRMDRKATTRGVGQPNATVQAATNQTNTSINQADVAESLKGKGIPSQKIDTLAVAIVARVNGQELTQTQRDVLRSELGRPSVQKVINELIQKKSNGIDNAHNDAGGQGTVLCLDKAQGYGILEQGDEICLEKHDRRQKVVFIM